MKKLAVAALFLVAACGSATTVSAHTISLAYKAGDSYKYALHFVLKYTVGIQSMGMSVPLDLDLSAKEAVKVNSVDSSGVADVTITLTDLTTKTSANGTTTTTTTASTTVNVKIGPDGRIVSVNGNAMGSSSLPGMSATDSGFVSAILPDHAVKPGDTWSKSYDQSNVAGSTGALHITSDNKYLRDEKVGSAGAAVVDSKIDATLDLKFDNSSGSGTPLFPSGSNGLQSMAMTGTEKSDVMSWIDTSARHVLKSHSTGSVDATLNITMAAGSTQPGLSGPITIKGTQTLDMNPA
ncbi:MAG TPA: hypothetical protein VFL27_04070 [Candidatus Dormibacteraeota bacterium]|nr:hypothetical protein [Candidatus Dormibacteraeota bacterium]